MSEENGTGRCARVGCHNDAAFTCSYLDRRGNACARSWCPQHSLEIGGRYYCARHASTIIAIGEEMVRIGRLPELENRSPSLVYWVGSDLDAEVPMLLAGYLDENANERIVIDPVALIAGGGRVSERRWERNWKVISHTGIAQKVTLQVLEENPTDIVVRVGRNVVARETPPWIAAREAGTQLAKDEELTIKQAFYRRLRDAMSAGLESEKHLPYFT